MAKGDDIGVMDESIDHDSDMPQRDGSPTPVYRILDLYFDDYDTASAAVQTPEAAGWFGDLQRLAAGGARVVFTNVEPT